MKWALNVLAAWSQFWNAIWGGNRDQSFSSRSYEASITGKWWGPLAVALINRLIWWEPDHCRRAWLADDEHTYGGGQA